MKTEAEAVADLLEEDRKFSELVEEIGDDHEAWAEADYLYQEGVRVDEIARMYREGKLVAQPDINE